jgi:hypothetical protein
MKKADLSRGPRPQQARRRHHRDHSDRPRRGEEDARRLHARDAVVLEAGAARPPQAGGHRLDKERFARQVFGTNDAASRRRADMAMIPCRRAIG